MSGRREQTGCPFYPVAYCCAGLTVILLVIGVMDLRAMAVVTAAITAERLAPAGEQVARASGQLPLGQGCS